MSSWFPLLILMTLLAAIAHGRTIVSNQNAQFLATTSLATGEGIPGSHSKQNLRNSDDSSSESALPLLVEDWSLVCKQFCGPGLGGIPCATYCKGVEELKTARTTNADSLLSSSNKFMCRKLCSLQLGGARCGCYATQSVGLITVKDQNVVCRSLCQHKNIQLNGCIPCTGKSPSYAKPHQIKYGNKGAEIIAFDEMQTTTPDWNQLCESLCKTGDGGSLCNCDLSPFFLK